MLAINGEPLNKATDAALVKHISAAMTAIKKKKHWMLVFHESKVQLPKPGEPIGHRETSAGINNKATAKYAFNGVEHDITYYTTINGVGEKKRFSPNYVDFGGPMALDPQRQADKIFFMTCVLPSCAPYEPLKNYQYLREFPDFHYQVEDLVADAIADNEIQRMASKVQSLLFSEDFALSDKDLVDIAANQGIPKAHQLDPEILRNKLRVHVLAQDKYLNYHADRIEMFINDSKDGTFAQLKSMIVLAIDKGILEEGKTSQGNRPAWYDKSEVGGKGSHLYTVPIGTDPLTALIQYYASRPKDRLAFEKWVQSSDGKPKAIKVKVEHEIEEVGDQEMTTDKKEVKKEEKK